ncbi:cytochrome c oxidase subunit 4 [Microlunatus elymi]|uniref:Cytochrome c oxidase polypeptide 4 n=1 Tax=Microlunatus elymi TaxID=2596828 RepID=A0A516Q2M1_9ACTN|nr:cytochrome c oxidase subunit 4 [Microlunatus elymi]QDP97666.1 cytochrome c oxidase subunit 4 [Microlunatus elymi]
MRAEARIFLILTAFFLIVAPVYWFTTHETTGTAALILTFFLSLMITGYLALIARRIDDRPEDKREGEIVEGAGEVGFFPPQSIWPLFCALSLAFVMVGIVIGWWIVIIAGALGVVSLTGMIYQYYRGEHAH